MNRTLKFSALIVALAIFSTCIGCARICIRPAPPPPVRGIPEIQAELEVAQARRAARAAEIEALKAAGLIGEGADGTLEIIADAPAVEFQVKHPGVFVAGDPSAILAGDVNDDGVINLLDAILLLRYVSGLGDVSPRGSIAADADSTGAVNPQDAVAIQQDIVRGD